MKTRDRPQARPATPPLPAASTAVATPAVILELVEAAIDADEDSAFIKSLVRLARNARIAAPPVVGSTNPVQAERRTKPRRNGKAKVKRESSGDLPHIEEIKRYIMESGNAHVQHLTKVLKLSAATVRQSLAALEKGGVVGPARGRAGRQVLVRP